jgi:hypothetical protein
VLELRPVLSLYGWLAMNLENVIREPLSDVVGVSDILPRVRLQVAQVIV